MEQLGSTVAPRTTVPRGLFDRLQALVVEWKAEAAEAEREGRPAPGRGNHHGKWFDWRSNSWRDGRDPRLAPLEAMMAQHGFSGQLESHANALLIAVNGVCAEVRREEAVLLAIEREASGPAGDERRRAIVDATLEGMVRHCGLPVAEAEACRSAGMALLALADVAHARGARQAKGGKGGRTAVAMPPAALAAAMAAARSGDLRSLLPHLIFTNGRHCTLNDHATADALCLWASSADVAPAAEAHTMAILGALARMRVGPPRDGKEPATAGCTRVPTGAGRSADECGMLGPDAFNTAWVLATHGWHFLRWKTYDLRVAALVGEATAAIERANLLSGCRRAKGATRAWTRRIACNSSRTQWRPRRCRRCWARTWPHINQLNNSSMAVPALLPCAIPTKSPIPPFPPFPPLPLIACCRDPYRHRTCDLVYSREGCA